VLTIPESPADFPLNLRMQVRVRVSAEEYAKVGRSRLAEARPGWVNTRLFMPLFRGVNELERRRAPRFEAATGVFCQILNPRNGRTWPAAIRDISLTGIALLASQQFEEGTLLTIELRNVDWGFVRKFLVEVRQSEICCPNDAFLHGCRFARPLRGEEMRALVGSGNRPTIPDQTRSG
jgi:hypothetical protein